MFKRSTIVLTAALVLGAASTAMAMGERNPVGRHSGPAVRQAAPGTFAGAGQAEYRFSAPRNRRGLIGRRHGSTTDEACLACSDRANVGMRSPVQRASIPV
jgi:hypothetical protein